MLTAHPTASMVLGPDGQLVAGALVGGEGILYADVDLGLEVIAKQAHDIVGTYQRADIFQLSVDTRRPSHCGATPANPRTPWRVRRPTG